MRHFPPEKKYFSHVSLSDFNFFFLLLNNTFPKFQLNPQINSSILNRNASASASFSQVATWQLNSNEVCGSIGTRVNAEDVMLGGGHADQAGTRGEDRDEGWRKQEREKHRNGLVMMNNCRG